MEDKEVVGSKDRRKGKGRKETGREGVRKISNEHLTRDCYAD